MRRIVISICLNQNVQSKFQDKYISIPKRQPALRPHPLFDTHTLLLQPTHKLDYSIGRLQDTESQLIKTP